MELTRRGLFMVLAGLTVVAPFALPRSWRRYGHLTVDEARWRGFLPARVLFNGRDVSDDCRECDDIQGRVVLMMSDASRKYFLSHNSEPAIEERFGRVEFYPKGTY